MEVSTNYSPTTAALVRQPEALGMELGWSAEAGNRSRGSAAVSPHADVRTRSRDGGFSAAARKEHNMAERRSRTLGESATAAQEGRMYGSIGVYSAAPQQDVWMCRNLQHS